MLHSACGNSENLGEIVVCNTGSLEKKGFASVLWQNLGVYLHLLTPPFPQPQYFVKLLKIWVGYAT